MKPVHCYSPAVGLKPIGFGISNHGGTGRLKAEDKEKDKYEPRRHSVAKAEDKEKNKSNHRGTAWLRLKTKKKTNRTTEAQRTQRKQ
jgi:hypothetical protein